jgi:hypothetical protein
MTERSQFWTTGTTGDGTTTISEAQTIEWFRDCTIPFASAGPHTSQGVLKGLLNELAVSGVASPVTVATGGAVVEGYYYKNDASVTVAIPTPVGSTRIDRIVLRASHSTTRTVRITRIAGTEGAGAPAITQVAGTTWDIPLAQVSITTGGVITVTDQRVFCHFATLLAYTSIDGGVVNRIPYFDSAGLLTSEAALTYAPASNILTIGDGAGLARANLDGAAANDTILSWYSAGVSKWSLYRPGSSNDLRLNDGSDRVTFESGGNVGIATTNPAAKLDVVGDAWLNGASMLTVYRRQGGDATQWATVGTTTYTPAGRVVTQVGSTGFAPAASGTITFPVAFSATPVVVMVNGPTAGTGISATISGVTTTGFSWATSGSNIHDIMWIAIGPL